MWISITISLIALLSCVESHIDVVFLIDGSQHTSHVLFRRELMLIPRIIDQLPLTGNDYRFGLVTYSDRAQLEMGIGHVIDQRALIDHLWHIHQHDSHRVGLCFALRLTRQILFDTRDYRLSNGPVGFVVIFSNGLWNLPDLTSYEAHLLKRIGVRIILVSTGHINCNLAHELTREFFYQPHLMFNHRDQSRIYNFIITNINTQININSNVDQSNTTTSTSRPPITGTATIPEQPSTITPAVVNCTMSGELVLVIDASGSTSTNYTKILNTVTDILHYLPIGPLSSGLSVAIVTYGANTAVINYNFDQFKSITNIDSAIKEMAFLGGKSNPGDGLSLTNQKLFMNTNVPGIRRRVVLFQTFVTSQGPDPIVISKVMSTTNGIAILPIGIDGNMNALKWVISRIASAGVSSIYLDTFEHLVIQKNFIVEAICRL